MTRRPIVAYILVTLATLTTGLIGFGVWVHHMFAVGLPQVSLAFFGAAWFLVHPVSVYGVAYLAERSIVLATLFSLIALWFLLQGIYQLVSPVEGTAYVAHLTGLALGVLLPLAR